MWEKLHHAAFVFSLSHEATTRAPTGEDSLRVAEVRSPITGARNLDGALAGAQQRRIIKRASSIRIASSSVLETKAKVVDINPISSFDAKAAMEMQCQQVIDGDKVHVAMVRYNGNLKRVQEAFEGVFEKQVESHWDRLKSRVTKRTSPRPSDGGGGGAHNTRKTPSEQTPSVDTQNDGVSRVKRSSSWDQSPGGAMNQYTQLTTEEQNLLQLVAVIGPQMCDEDSLMATLAQGLQERVPFITSLSNHMTRNVRRLSRLGGGTSGKAALMVLESILAKKLVQYDRESKIQFVDK